MPQLTISRRRLVLLGVAMAACLAALMLAAPPADAFPSVGGMVETAVKKIFGVQGDWLTGTFLQWLIKIPDVGLTSDGGPAEVYEVTRSIAFALLGAVLTLSSIHYLASGMTSQGGGAGAAIEGALRTGGAALMILAWPYLVDNGITLAHIASDVIVPGDKLGDVTKLFLTAATVGAVFGNGIPLIIAIVVTIAFAVIILIIFTTKVMLGASLMVIASGMPLALAVWPIPALSWLTTGLMRWCVGIVSVQLAWAVEFGLYARVPEDFFRWSGAGAFVDKLIAPLTMLALLMLMLSTARTMLRLAGLNTSGGRMISNTAALMVSRFGMNAISRHVPDRFGGTQGLVAERAARAAAEAEKQSGKNGGAKPKNDKGSNGGGKGSGGASNGGPNPGSSGSAPGGQGSQKEKNPQNGRPGEPPAPPRTARDGIPTRPGHAEAHREARQQMQRLRDSGNQRGPGDVARALDTMKSEGLDAGAVANHISAGGASDGSVTSRMADAELASGLSLEAAAAFRTIGVAEPNARAAGVSLWQARQTSSSASASGGPSSGSGGGTAGTPPAVGTGGPRPARDSSPTNGGGPGSGNGSSSPIGGGAGGGAGSGGAAGGVGAGSGGSGGGGGSGNGGGGTSGGNGAAGLGNGGPRPATSSPRKPRRATRPTGPPPERPASSPPAQPPKPPPAQPPAPTAP